MKEYSNLKFEYNKENIKNMNLISMNFDYVCYSKETGKPIIFEWLKRGPDQKDHITPFTSNPRNYINMNKGKFAAYQFAINTLGAEVYYINYAPEGTIINGKDISEQVKIMKHISVKIKNGREIVSSDNYMKETLSIDLKNIATFSNLMGLSNWLNIFLEEKCFEINGTIEDPKNLTKEEAKNYIKSKEVEYETQQDKARSNNGAYKKYLVMPDLSGDMFEKRLKVDFDKYRLQIDKQFYSKEQDFYIMYNEVVIETDPGLITYEEAYNKIKKVYENSLFMGFEQVNVFVFINIERKNVAILTIKNGKEELEYIESEEIVNKIRNLLLYDLDEMQKLSDIYFNNKIYDKTFKWQLMAANQGSHVDQYKVAQGLLYGSGVERDLNNALAWCEFSAENGNEIARINIENFKEALKIG